MLLNAEYESNKSETMSGISGLSGLSGLSNTKTEPQSIELQYSRIARKQLKRFMSIKHLKAHQRDNQMKLKCHHKKIPSDHLLPENLTRNLILSIIYLALNLTKDKIQLSDLIRFLSEGHLSNFDVKHFFPENLSAEAILKIKCTYNKISAIPSANELRNLTAKLSKFLNVPLIEPNMLSLCSKYLMELSLPKILNDYIEKILDFFPPQPEASTVFRSSNFEARAISYIIFLLKLIFKLDGKVEEEISKTAENLNKNYGTNIFVWTEWVKFIETRTIILKQCHYPTSFLLEPDSEDSSSLYLEYFRFLTSKTELLDKNDGIMFTKIKSMLVELEKIQKSNLEKSKKSYLFDPSHQPHKDYLEKLLDERPESILIPDYMSVNHTERDLACYIKPNSFRNKLHSKGIDLNINPITNKNLPKVDWFVNEKFYELQLKRKVGYFKIKFEDENSESEVPFCIKPEKIVHKAVKRLTNNKSKVFDNLSDDELPNELTNNLLEKVQFNMTNFDYWSYRGELLLLSYENFNDIEKKFSSSFAWVLHQCCRLLQMDSRDLYQELLVTEKFLFANT